MLQQSLLRQLSPSKARTRPPTIEDGGAIADLVRSTGALEPNSTYGYLLLSHHFAATSAVAESEGKVVGCLLGYRVPARPNCVFVWQIGTAPTHRRQGIGRQLLREIHERPALGDVTDLEFTVAASNTPSLSLFQSWARELRAEFRPVGQFSSALFGSSNHEDEVLYRIGPLTKEAS